MILNDRTGASALSVTIGVRSGCFEKGLVRTVFLRLLVLSPTAAGQGAATFGRRVASFPGAPPDSSDRRSGRRHYSGRKARAGSLSPGFFDQAQPDETSPITTRERMTCGR
ncbi:hypothetical protein [Streptomyces sp. NPDC049585]|uniref:hypothetical protein n=1 Tax=Streptomyces sp. NPDC049585 TaxID=3155154 RepID=UPI00341DDF04